MNVLSLGPSLLAALILLGFFVTALAGAYFVFKFLKGTAQITRKDIQLTGSAAMFVIMFILLNHYFHDIYSGAANDFGLLRSAEAAQPVKQMAPSGSTEVIATVGLSPATQRVSLRDLFRLDRNSYLIDEELRVALPRIQSDNWEIMTGKDTLKVIGLMDIPAYASSMAGFAASASAVAPKSIVMREKRQHKISLGQDGIIATAKVTLNLFADDEFFAGTVKTLEDLQGATFPEMEVKLLQMMMKEKFDRVIDRKLPLEKEIRNGLMITFLDNETLTASTINRIFPRKNILELAFNSVFIGGSASYGSFSNLYANVDRGIYSFNGSVEIENATIDNKKTNAIINNIGFLLDLGTRVAFIQVVYFGGDPIETFKTLQASLNGIQMAP